MSPYEFCSNPNNSMSCYVCPYNIGSSWLETALPCGQLLCWVDVTCAENEKQESES